MNQDIADQRRRRWRGTTSTAGAVAGRERVRTALGELCPTSTMSRRTWFAEETYVHYDEHAEHIAAFVDGLPGLSDPGYRPPATAVRPYPWAHPPRS